MKGIINLNKEPGMSSHAVVAAVRRIIGEKKTGHPGTLDPMASGVLPILVGGATRCSDRFLDMPKTYAATARFGLVSDTQDIWGNIVSRFGPGEVKVTEDEIREKLKAFCGDILQKPPAFSALKKDGKPLYKLARKGIEVETCERPVKVYEAALTRFFNEEGCPAAEIRITCGRGTYIRTIINDLGELLGTGAVMSALQRVSYGDLRIEDAVTLGELAAIAGSGDTERVLLPVESVFRGLPEADLSVNEKIAYMQGKNVFLTPDRIDYGQDRPDACGDREEVLVKCAGKLFATARLVPAEGQSIQKDDSDHNTTAGEKPDGETACGTDGRFLLRLVPGRFFGE